MIRVKAKAAGYYGSYRVPGDEFEIRSPEDFGRWMVILDEPPPLVADRTSDEIVEDDHPAPKAKRTRRVSTTKPAQAKA